MNRSLRFRWTGIVLAGDMQHQWTMHMRGFIKGFLNADLFTFLLRCVVWMARTLTRSASTPSSGVLTMAVLLIILLTTIGLSARAGLYGRSWRIADSETSEDSWLIEACARTFVLVLLSLLGLLALGVMYGNVLGATNVSNP